MAADTEDADREDPTVAATRLEAALERIAGLAHRPHRHPQPGAAEPSAPEIAARLDALIERVRAALGAG